MNTDKWKNSKMLPPADQQAFQKNAESLLHVAARVLPVHTRKHKIVLKKDPLVEPLTEHSIHESAESLKKELKKPTRHLANAKEDQMKPLDIASKFDFVGGGAIHIARHQLTGA